MADTFTTNLNLTKPEPGAAEDTWGISLNSDLDTLDAIFSSSGTQVNLNPNQVNFADDKKAIFGTGSDLEIYHDGSHSYIKDVGTGSLYIQGQGNIYLQDDTGAETYARFQRNNAVKLYFDNDLKFATTSEGIDVTGTTVTDGLTVNSGDTSSFLTIRNGSNSSFTKLYSDLNGVTVLDVDANNVGSSPRFQIDVSEVQALRITEGGDISFYDDTGSTQGLFWDASTERLGIGTTSPSQELVIRSAQPTILLEDSDNNAFGSIEVSSGNINISADGGSGIASSNIDFLVDGSQKIRIDSDGQLGIGTTAPSSILHVSSDSTPTIKVTDTTNDVTGTFYANNFDSYLSSTSRLIFQTGGSIAATISASQKFGIGTTSPTGLLHTKSTGDNNFYLESGATNLGQILFTDGSIAGRIKYNHSDDSMAFFANASEKARLNSTGLGIGTTSPTSTLTVNGDARIEKTGAASRLVINRYDLNTADSSTIDLLESSSQGASFGNAGVYGYRLELDGSTNNLNIKSGNATTVSTRLSIERDTGNIGIGTSSPQDKLSIEGGNVSINNGSAFQVGGSVSGNTVIGTLKSESGVLTLKADSTRDVQFGSETNGTAMFIEGSNGNVGIGTTSPSGLLEISADSDDGTSAPSFLITNASTTLNDGAVVGTIEFRNSDASGTPPHTAKIQGIANASDERTTELAFSTGSVGTTTERLRIASDGSVGIGTDNPVVTLNVDSNAQNEIARFQGANAQLRIDNNTLNVINLNSGGSGDALALSTGSSEAMRIDSSGNVGIGTTSPNAPLHIANGTPAIRLEDTSAGVSHYLNSNNAEFRVQASGSLALYTAGNNRVHINNTGSVGIGTISPSYLLDVESSSTGNVTLAQFKTNESTYNGLLVAANNNAGWIGNGTLVADEGILFQDTSSAMRFYTASSERMRIDSSGNIGIGTSAPSYFLHVRSPNASDDVVYIHHDNASQSSGTLLKVRTDAGDSNGYTLLDVQTNSGSALFVRGDRNVGIGTDSPAEALHIQTANDTKLRITKTGTDSIYAGVDTSPFIQASSLRFMSDSTTEKARITSSGELLLNKTSASVGTDGVQLRPSSYSGFSATSTTALFVNRNTDDGDVVEIGKNGVKVGSIGTSGGTTYIAGLSNGYRFGAAGLLPATTTGSNSDNTHNLGDAAVRFKNLYLSDTAFIGTSSNTSGNRFVHVDGDADGVTTGYKVRTGVDGTGTSYHNAFVNPNGIVGTISTNGSATAYNTSSDARLKDVTGEARGLEVITKLNPVAYNWKADGKADEGLIAQEVKEIVPNAVSGSEDEHYQMDYSKLVTHLVAGMKEQQEQIESLKSEIAKLKGE